MKNKLVEKFAPDNSAAGTEDEVPPTSVASQHKLQAIGTSDARQPETLSNQELHNATLDARDEAYERCVQTAKYLSDALLPLCEEIIQRYKLQGVAAKDRPNGQPTVEAYFKSIDLNYSTVRSWIHRKKLQTEMFEPKSGGDKNLGATGTKKPPAKEERRGGSDAPAPDVPAVEDSSVAELDDLQPPPTESVIEAPVKVANAEPEATSLEGTPEGGDVEAPAAVEPASETSEEPSKTSGAQRLPFELFVIPPLQAIEERLEQELSPLRRELEELWILPPKWDYARAERCMILAQQMGFWYACEASLWRKRLRKAEKNVKACKESSDKLESGVAPLLDCCEKPDCISLPGRGKLKK